MPRTSIVRSASLAPEEARLADELAQALTRGSFTELTRFFLHQFGEPLKRQREALTDSGLHTAEHLKVLRATPADSDEQIRDFYAPSTWSEGRFARP